MSGGDVWTREELLLREAAARLAMDIYAATNSIDETVQLLEGEAIREWCCDMIHRADEAAATARRTALGQGMRATGPTRSALLTCPCGRHIRTLGHRLCCSRCDGTPNVPPSWHTRRCHMHQVQMTIRERSHATEEETATVGEPDPETHHSTTARRA